MRLHIPVVHSRNGAWVASHLEAEVREISRREAPVALRVSDMGHLVYRLHEGRLYKAVDRPLDKTDRISLLTSYRPGGFGLPPIGQQDWKWLPARSPFFPVHDKTPFIGAGGKCTRVDASQEEVAASRMGKVVRRMVDHAIVIEDELHFESVGPVIVHHARSASLALIDGHHSWRGGSAFAPWDVDRIAEYCRRNGVHGLTDRFEGMRTSYDPAPRMIEGLADFARQHASSDRINQMSRERVAVYGRLERMMREGWRGTPGNEGGTPIWPYQQFDAHSLVGAEAASMLDEIASILPTREGRLDMILEVAREYVEDGRVPSPHRPELDDLVV